MRIAKRLAALALSATVVGALLAAVPASADTVETRPESFIATAAARGLDLNLFGTHVTIGSSSAMINSTPVAKASGAGVALIGGTTSTAEVNAAGQSQAPPKACVLNLPIASLLTVNLACGEAKVDTNLVDGKPFPQAFGHGSVAGLDVGAITLLQPVIDLLQQLLNALTPVLDQTVGTVLNVLTPTLSGLLQPLAGNLGLNTQSSVTPVSDLVNNLLNGIKRATQLVGIKVGDSTAQTNTAADKVVATANAAGAQIDLFPGFAAVGGAPLLSIIVGQAKSVSTYDRATAVSTPTFDAAVVRVKLGLPLLGVNGLDIPVQLNQPLTLLAGTPLESTISLGAGRTVRNDGSVASYADGVSVQLLKGLNGGIGLELAHAETGVGGQARLVSQVQAVTPVQPALAKTGNDPWPPLAGAGFLLVAVFIRRRLVAARPVRARVPVTR